MENIRVSALLDPRRCDGVSGRPIGAEGTQGIGSAPAHRHKKGCMDESVTAKADRLLKSRELKLNEQDRNYRIWAWVTNKHEAQNKYKKLETRPEQQRYKEKEEQDAWRAWSDEKAAQRRQEQAQNGQPAEAEGRDKENQGGADTTQRIEDPPVYLIYQ